MDSIDVIKKEPLVLHESPMFIGLIYSENKRVKRHLQDQAIRYGIDVLDVHNIMERRHQGVIDYDQQFLEQSKVVEEKGKLYMQLKNSFEKNLQF